MSFFEEIADFQSENETKSEPAEICFVNQEFCNTSGINALARFQSLSRTQGMQGIQDLPSSMTLSSSHYDCEMSTQDMRFATTSQSMDFEEMSIDERPFTTTLQSTRFRTKEQTQTYYHFTDDKGAEGIAKEKKIRPSTNPKDTIMGEGVYLTTKDPNKHSKYDILKNNYGDLNIPLSTIWDRVKNVIEIELPPRVVRKANFDRDVYKYESEGHLDLNKYKHKIKKVKDQ